MSRPAVIFDLDDTLIVEEAFAMASLRDALAVLPGVDPTAHAAEALESIRSVWRRGADFAVCVELGFASWEGLWSDFAGNHGVLARLHAWAPTYRAEAWAAVAGVFGVDDPALVDEAADRFEAAQRAGHPAIDGMRPALDAVSARYPVGLLTNGPSDIQRLKLAQAGLAAIRSCTAFRSRVASSDCLSRSCSLAREALSSPLRVFSCTLIWLTFCFASSLAMSPCRSSKRPS